MAIKLLSISQSDKPGKKMMARFEIDGRENTTHFGDATMKDYTSHPKPIREARKAAYLSRHKANENWDDPTSAGALSRWVLWNKPSIRASIEDYRRRFNL
jgi:hypothetical protein